MEEIKVKYFVDGIDELCYVEGKSDWIDLHAAEDVTLHAGEYRLLPLGVAMALPEGYEAHVVPRSSTFKNYGLLQTNSMGVVDYTYRGDNDQWRVPMYATRDVHIDKNTRISQFRIMKTIAVGVVDCTYRGDGDQWFMPAYATRDVTNPKNARICQFRIMRNQPRLHFTRVEHLEGPDRGGFGSTGI